MIDFEQNIQEYKDIIQEKKFFSNFSDSEWKKLTAIFLTSEWDFEQLKQFWQNLLIRWITRNNNPQRNVFQELFFVLEKFIDVFHSQFPDKLKDLNQLFLHVSNSYVKQQANQYHLLEFESNELIERISGLELETEKTKGDVNSILELNLFINQSLIEEEIIQNALDGLLGVLDANFSGAFIIDKQSQSLSGKFYIYHYGECHSLNSFNISAESIWSKFLGSKYFFKYSEELSQYLSNEKEDIWALFPKVESVIFNQLKISEHLIGFIILSSEEKNAFSGFTNLVNIVSTHIASSIQNARLHAKINELAIRDPSTGLFNRRYLEERFYHSLETARRYSRDLSVIMMDIDNFKKINDTYGHQVGDLVIESIAKLVQKRLRNTDIFARYGGEEFIIILIETGRKGVVLVAEDLVKLIRNNSIDYGKDKLLNVTVSSGYSTFPFDGQSTQELISIADQGLYLAKNSGKDRVGFCGHIGMTFYDYLPRFHFKTSVALGTFDGLHLGHRKVIQSMLSSAKESELKSVVLSFSNHPMEIIGQTTPQLITTAEEKASLIRSMYIDHCVLLEFTHEFSEISAEGFIKDILCKQLNVGHVSVGYNFRFGHQAKGDVEMLQRYGQELGFEVTVCEPFKYQGELVTSTNIRNYITEGSFEKALPLLSDQFLITGKVIRGQGLATKALGLPTANIAVTNPQKLLPVKGVYVCSVFLPSTNMNYDGVVNIGNRPTFKGQSLSVEVYILNFEENIYGEQLSIYLKKFIREEIAFDGVEKLKLQIHEDIKYTQDYLLKQKKV